MSDESNRLERIYAEKRVASEPVPLAAIFKTRRERRRESSDTDPAQSWDTPLDEPPALIDEHLEPVGLEPPEPVIGDGAPLDLFSADGFLDDTVDMAVEPAPMSSPALSVAPLGDEAHPLRQLIPPSADPAWARDTLLAIANQDALRFRTPTAGAWFAEMFTEEYLQSQPVRGDSTTRAELHFLDWALQLEESGTLLDLGCGIGQHAVGMAAAGHRVHAIDLSDTMLRYAGRLAEHAGVEIEPIRMDMRDLDEDGAYDGAWCLNTSFGYFTDVENVILLRSIHRALKPAGRLVLDVINRDHAALQLPTRNWWEGDGCLIQEDIEFAHRTSRLEVRRYLVFADGRERVHDISIRLFSPHELVQLLTLAGFIVESVSGSPHTQGAFFGPRSARLMIVARRPTRG